ncbi:MAG: hypothetical protein HW416_727 [Chloroflexi bacterium]|nr:hypothetical protein [Chloroflexota bacterium]
MDFGIFSESGRRQHPSIADAYEEDLAEIIAADGLGMTEAWIAEPNHVRINTVTNAGLLMANAAARTEQIKFGSGIRQLPLHHPINLVQEANALDQLTRGRYMFGYGGTHLMSLDQLRQRGIDIGHEDTRPMVYEALDLILRCWSSGEPFDFEGKYWHGTDIDVRPKPYQSPHPPIAAGCSGSLETVEVAGRHGFGALFGRGNDPGEAVRTWADTYVRAAEGAGLTPSRCGFHVTHFVHVAETDERARADVRASVSAMMVVNSDETAVYRQRHLKPGMTLDDITFDYMCDDGHYWVGSPDTVYRIIKDYYEATGGFGVLLIYCGLPYATLERRTESMHRFMEQVAPRLAQLDPDREPVEAR